MKHKTSHLRIALTLIGSVLLSGIKSQNLNPSVLASAGESIDIASFNYSYTVGETAIFTLENEEMSVLQGFHQPAYFMDVKVVETDRYLKIEMYPNPTDGKLVFHWSSDKSGFYLDCLDLTGAFIFRTNVSSEKNWINVNDLMAGTYIIQLKDVNNREVFCGFVIKI